MANASPACCHIIDQWSSDKDLLNLTEDGSEQFVFTSWRWIFCIIFREDGSSGERGVHHPGRGEPGCHGDEKKLSLDLALSSGEYHRWEI